MTVSNPREVPEYELKPGEFQFRRGDEIMVASSCLIELLYCVLHSENMFTLYCYLGSSIDG